ncbi:MAG TPA: type VI secretion system-associated protein TagF [Paracoccaceae bacterium]|nr:type VI secretion system-associated protein TagF [Paracoccaceae bacterium]HMO71707.1 type VI secretion system-associated protein TagF [Paracoccaceae bacterium]
MASRFGAFGKLPALGDFLRMDLPQGFVDPWDRWLQEGMVAAKGALGDRWQDCYFSAPLWRFALSPGLAGASAMLGVMMMSVDRVGRQFPLTLASPLGDGAPVLVQHFISSDVYGELEALALDALEDGMTKDVLAQRLGAMALPQAPDLPQMQAAQGGLVLRGSAAHGMVPELAAMQAGARFRKPSVWAAELDDGLRLMVCEGLPAGGQLMGLFDMMAQVWQPAEAEPA